MRLRDNGRPYGHDAWHAFEEIRSEYSYAEWNRLEQTVRDAKIDRAMGRQAPTPPPAPAVELSAATRTLIAEKIAALRKPTPAAIAQPVAEPDRRTSLERGDDDWRKSPDLRAEFRDDFGRYQGWLKAEKEGVQIIGGRVLTVARSVSAHATTTEAPLVTTLLPAANKCGDATEKEAWHEICGSR